MTPQEGMQPEFSENDEHGIKPRHPGARSPVSSTRITDELVLDCLNGNTSALERLYLGSVRWLESLIRDREGLNVSRWGTVVTGDIPHDVVSRTVGPDGSRLMRFASFRNPAAGYLRSLQTAFERKLIDSHKRWDAKERLHVGPSREPETPTERPGTPYLDRLTSEFPNPDEEAAANDLLYFIRQVAMATLKDEERSLLFCEIDGETRSQAATRLGIPEQTVAVRMSRIRSKLLQAFTKALQTPNTLSDS